MTTVDPNVTLEHIRKIVERLRALDLVGELPYDVEVDITALLHAVEALDQHLSRGGFIPRAWRSAVDERSVVRLPDDGTHRFAHNEPTPVEAIQRELNAHPTWGVDVGPPGYRDEVPRPNDATHPRELPNPADEAAFFAAVDKRRSM